MLIDWQTIATFIIVAASAFVVGRRIFGQLLALRQSASHDSLHEDASACSGCSGCGSRRAARQSNPQILTIAVTAPPRIRPARAAADTAERK